MNIYLFAILFLLTSCDPFLSKEQERNITEIKRYVKNNPGNINYSHEKFGIPINYAILNNYTFLLKWLIQHNADVNIKNKNGETPLHRSIICISKKNENMLLLIKNKSNINAKDNYGNTPLHTAITFAKIDAVKIILSNGAKVNPRARRGETPLHYAARLPFRPNDSKVKVAKLLLMFGADINEKDNHGKTPILDASLVGNVEMTDYLIKESANPNISTNSGNSPLHIASSMGHSKVVEILIKGGAKVNQRNDKGMTPLQYALHFPAIHYEAEKNEPVDTKAVVEILQKHGGIE